MNTSIRALLTLCACSSLITVITTVTSSAKTILVPSDSVTIQAGINGAATGDTVLVADGTYTGVGNRDIDFGGKNIILVSENGPDVTTINCQATWSSRHYGFVFDQQEDSTAVVEGFTIRNGMGVHLYYFMEYESSVDAGGGIYVDGASPTVRNCVLKYNRAGFGGAIFARDADMKIVACVIRDNRAYGCGTVPEDGPCQCVPGRGSAIAAINATIRFNQCTIVGNKSYDYGCDCKCPGEYAVYAEGGSVAITNSIIAFNQSPWIGCTDSVWVECSDVFGNGANDWVNCVSDQSGIAGNISLDPGFCAIAYDDYHLSISSPCLPENNSCGVQIGALGAGCTADVITGDVNCDGIVDLSDIVALGNALDGLTSLTGTCAADAADLDGDSDTDEDDYNLLFDEITGMGL